MKVLITGGAGFIGSHVTELLLEAGHQVAIMDNILVQKYHIDPEAKLYPYDIAAEEAGKVFSSFRPEVVFHLAAQISVQNSMSNPRFDASENLLGTIAVLEHCRSIGAKKIIFSSTAAVYGQPLSDILTETNPIKPQSFYGLSKYSAEEYIKLFANLYDLDYTILRYANVYGERQDFSGEGSVILNFIEKLLSGNRPIIFGTGEQTRDFIFVRDVAAANLAALTLGSKETYNISSHQSVSINKLLKQLCEILKVSVKANYDSPRLGDILHSRLDHNKAVKELTWKPQFSLEEGLRLTCAYFKNQRSDNPSGSSE